MYHELRKRALAGGDFLASDQRFLDDSERSRCTAAMAGTAPTMTASSAASSFVVHRGASVPGPALAGAVVAIGNFDGVHRGHRAVIGAALERARALGRPAAALTFEPHPRSFFRPGEPLFRLTDETNKLRLFAATGLDGAVVM